MPARWALAVLLFLATAPPFIAESSGAVVGSFAMFARLDRYHVEVTVETEGAPSSI